VVGGASGFSASNRSMVLMLGAKQALKHGIGLSHQR
jgi:hypothetical protein